MSGSTRRALSALTALVLIGTLFVGAPGPTYANGSDTYYVAQTGEPDGDGSSCTDPDFVGGDAAPIALAVDLATDGDTIYICAGIYAIETNIVLGGGLTLQGAGAGVTILDGGNTFNEDGSSNNNGHRILAGYGAITVSDIAFQNAYYGAIWAPDVALAVFSSSFLNNTTDSYGGAIYNGDSGTVTIIDSTFTGNTAPGSGGAVWTATAVVSESTFTNNDAANDGGAIGTDVGNVTVSESIFKGNSAGDDGGAVYAGSTITATSSTFTGNSAGSSGGAIAATNVTSNISSYTNNIAYSGGAIYALFTTANRSTFIGNESQFGGAIDSFDATITSSNFMGNSAIQLGGAIAVASGTIEKSRFISNSSGEHGGAILLYSPNDDAIRQLRGNSFTRNRAGAGGAITLGPCVEPTRSGAARVERANRFSGNRATQRRTNNVERWTEGC